jgi:hypothetical protein
MQQDGGNPPDDGPATGQDAAPMQRVAGSADTGGPAPGVRLRREFKGLTVRDLLADAGLDAQLPGAVRSALAHVERGDLAAADRALPGHFAPLLPGPGRDRLAARRRLARWITLAALAAAATTATIKLL